MGATEEQMALLSDAHVTHVSYVLILYSVAFLLYLCPSPPLCAPISLKHALTQFAVVNMLLHVYATWAWPESTKPDPESGRQLNGNLNGNLNGHPRRGHANSRSVEQRLRDAEEFELEGLISDDEAGLDGDTDAEPESPRHKEGRVRM